MAIAKNCSSQGRKKIKGYTIPTILPKNRIQYTLWSAFYSIHHVSHQGRIDGILVHPTHGVDKMFTFYTNVFHTFYYASWSGLSWRSWIPSHSHIFIRRHWSSWVWRKAVELYYWRCCRWMIGFGTLYKLQVDRVPFRSKGIWKLDNIRLIDWQVVPVVLWKLEKINRR